MTTRLTPTGSADDSGIGTAIRSVVRPCQHRQRVLPGRLRVGAQGQEPVAQLVWDIGQVAARRPVLPAEASRVLRVPQSFDVLTHQNLHLASRTSTLDTLTEKWHRGAHG